MQGPLDVHRELLARDIPHEICHLRSVAASADDLPSAAALDERRCVVVRCLLAGGRLVALIVPAGTDPHPEAVAELAGTPVRPAPLHVVAETTGYHARLVPPVGLPAEVPVWAHHELASPDIVYAPTGDGATMLGIAAHDLVTASYAILADLQPQPAALEVPAYVELPNSGPLAAQPDASSAGSVSAPRPRAPLVAR